MAKTAAGTVHRSARKATQRAVVKAGNGKSKAAATGKAVRTAGRPGPRVGQKLKTKVAMGNVPKVDHDWFFDRLKDQGKSMRGMARFMNLDPSTLSKLLSGVRWMKIDEAELIARFLDVPVDLVLSRAGLSAPASEVVPGEARLVPVVGAVNVAGAVTMTGDLSADLPTVRGPTALPSGAVAIQADYSVAGRGRARELAREAANWLLLDHAYLMFVPGTRFDPAAVERLSVVRVGRTTMLRRITRSADPDAFDLVGFGSRETAAKIDAASPVLWIRT